eukprot:jgi/Botrbrau1/16999/Bobra.49_2s0058.1
MVWRIRITQARIDNHVYAQGQRRTMPNWHVYVQLDKVVLGAASNNPYLFDRYGRHRYLLQPQLRLWSILQSNILYYHDCGLQRATNNDRAPVLYTVTFMTLSFLMRSGTICGSGPAGKKMNVCRGRQCLQLHDGGSLDALVKLNQDTVK